MMVPSPSMNSLGMTNPRWQMFIDFLKESFDRRLEIVKSCFDQQENKLAKMAEEMRVMDQRASSLDGQAGTKTCKRTEGAATAVQAIHG